MGGQRIIRIGFYGTGKFARTHAESLGGLGADLVACWGTNKEKTARFAADFACRSFDAWTDMVDREHVDLLYIVIPPFAHDGYVEALAIERGMPFFTEKPVGLDLEKAREIGAPVSERNLITSVGYQYRYLDTTDTVRDLLAGRRISMIRSWRFGACGRNPWWVRMDRSGGMMVEQGTHAVDLLRFLLGEVTSVYASTTTGIVRERVPEADIYDSLSAVLEFEAGFIGSVDVSCTLERSQARQVLLEVVADEFHLLWDLNELRYAEGSATPAVLKVDATPAHDAQNRALLEAVRTQDASGVRSMYSDAVKTLALTLAMSRSADTGRCVRVGGSQQEAD